MDRLSFIDVWTRRRKETNCSVLEFLTRESGVSSYNLQGASLAFCSGARMYRHIDIPYLFALVSAPRASGLRDKRIIRTFRST